MKHPLFLQGLAAAILTLCAACTADLGDTLAEPQPLVFSAAQGGVTVSTRAATNGTWEGGEAVAIKIGTEVKKYIVAKSGALTPDDNTTPFYRTDKSAIDYTAWYPYSPSEPDAPTIVTDQSTTEAQESCNLMKASGTAVYGATTIQLQFSHQAARLQLCLTDVDKTTSVPGATVTFTVDDKTLTAYEDKDSEGKGTGKYSVLVAPGTTVAKITITVGSGETYTYTATAAATFKAGICYTYNISLAHSYLTFSAASTQVFKMTIGSSFTETFEYSVGNGAWTTITSKKEVTFGGTNGTLRLRGKSANGTATSTSTSNCCTISFTKTKVPVTSYGDIRTLVNYESYNAAGTKSAKFCNLFKDCTALTSAPALLATELAESCYEQMFNGCTNLQTAPALPATKLAGYCYSNMFYGCTALTQAPELPATTLVNGCYYYMFNGCSKLNEVTIKAEAQLVTSSLDNWLDGVANKGTFYCKKDFYDKISSSNFKTWPPPSGWTVEYITN